MERVRGSVNEIVNEDSDEKEERKRKEEGGGVMKNKIRR